MLEGRLRPVLGRARPPRSHGKGLMGKHGDFPPKILRVCMQHAAVGIACQSVVTRTTCFNATNVAGVQKSRPSSSQLLGACHASHAVARKRSFSPQHSRSTDVAQSGNLAAGRCRPLLLASWTLLSGGRRHVHSGGHCLSQASGSSATFFRMHAKDQDGHGLEPESCRHS